MLEKHHAIFEGCVEELTVFRMENTQLVYNMLESHLGIGLGGNIVVVFCHCKTHQIEFSKQLQYKKERSNH